MQKKINSNRPSFLTKELENCWIYLRLKWKIPQDFGTFLNSAVASAEEKYFLQEKSLEQIKLDVFKDPSDLLRNIEFELSLLKGALLPLAKESDAIDTLMYPRVNAQHLLRKVSKTIIKVKKLSQNIESSYSKTQSLLEENQHFAGGRVLTTPLPRSFRRMRKVFQHLN